VLATQRCPNEPKTFRISVEGKLPARYGKGLICIIDRLAPMGAAASSSTLARLFARSPWKAAYVCNMASRPERAPADSYLTN